MSILRMKTVLMDLVSHQVGERTESEVIPRLRGIPLHLHLRPLQSSKVEVVEVIVPYVLPSAPPGHIHTRPDHTAAVVTPGGEGCISACQYK